MRRQALGVQARAALHLAGEPVPAAALNRFIGGTVSEQAPPADAPPLGVPAIFASEQAAEVDRQRRAAERQELVTLRARVADLEAELAAVTRDTDRRIAAAVATVERRQTEHAARTMGGAVLSIFKS